MNITFLGTGTSHGIPVITCTCPVCISTEPHNKRLRSSILIESTNTSVLIDTTPEFRLQAIRANIKNIDGILYTHAHADHLHGIDDVRPYSVKHHIPFYGSESVIEEIKSRFSYIFNMTPQKGGGKPNLIPTVITKNIILGDLKITPIPIKHGVLNIYGYRINNMAYLTDCSKIPDSSYKLLENLDTLIIGALRYRPHSTHFSIDESIEEVRKIAPKNAYFTHFCHDVDHYKLLNDLVAMSVKDPVIKKIKPAHDGLCLQI